MTKRKFSGKKKKSGEKKECALKDVINKGPKKIKKGIFRPEHRVTPPHIRRKIKRMKKTSEFSDTVVFSNKF